MMMITVIVWNHEARREEAFYVRPTSALTAVFP